MDDAPAGADGDTGTGLVAQAERALHERARLACGAATSAGLDGRFRVWQDGDVLAVLATAPALAFLSTVAGVTSRTVDAAVALLRSATWSGVAPTVLVPHEQDGVTAPVLRAAGLVPGPDRALATRWLGGAPVDSPPGPLQVVGADAGTDFLGTLLEGYAAEGAVAAFLAAEHRHPAVRRYLVQDGDLPVGAGAMTLHGDVAVLGGASTLPAQRGRGAQGHLLAQRLRVAAQAGCAVAVSTVRPGSASEVNLRRAGFRIHRRSAWTAAGA